jgi:hypothetical protein
MKADRLRVSIRRPGKVCVLTAGLCLLVAASAKPQGPARERSESAKPAAAESSSSQPEKKPRLADITRVSTTEAARGAARDQANPEEGVAQIKTEESTEPAVVELKSTPKEAEASGRTVAVQDSKGSKPLKVHGRAHGSLDSQNSGNNQTGAAVGVGSKSGKTNIYVETERSRRTTPPTR